MRELDRVIGYESIKSELYRIIDIIKNPEKYKKLGAFVYSYNLVLGNKAKGLLSGRIAEAIKAQAALLAASAVSVVGLLGFVGLIVPNILRLSDRLTVRRKILGCIVWGSILVLACDTLMRTLFYPFELPAGLLLSMIGTPFFILVLMRRGIRGKRHD